jgi:DNA-binding GntR family transcriptional regulator
MQIDDYILDVLMPDLIGHDRQPSAFIVYLRLWRLTSGGRKKSGPLSLRDLAEQTGLSKRAIQDAVDRLERRQLVAVERAMPTAVPVYQIKRPWHRGSF